jgi:signal transduction histidine kinase
VRRGLRHRLGLGRAGLRFRVLTLVGIGTFLPAALVTTYFWSRLVEADGRLLSSRQIAAAAAADRVDEDLRSDLEALQRIASTLSLAGAERQGDRARELLRQAYVGFRFMGGLFLLDAHGLPVLEEPHRTPSIAPPPDLPELRVLLESGKPQVSGLVRHGEGYRIYAMVVLSDWHGRTAGVVGGLIDPGLARQVAVMRFLVREGEGYAELVDGKGAVIASTDRARTHLRGTCPTFTGGVIRDRAPRVQRCQDCHALAETRSVVASAPLAVAPWAVVVVQPEGSVLATGEAVPSAFPVFAAFVILLAGGLAWGAARSVTRPVERLTAAAEKISGGHLEDPIPDLGSDEVGRLGRALDAMRVSLAELLARDARAQNELEARVEARTRELAAAMEALRQRETQRARLLRTVITAQEDERKRIARELHDETTQSLAVLVMGVESALQTLPAGGPAPRLEEVKALAVHILDEVHRLILDLRPSVLDDLGLFSAVRWYAERNLSPRGISVRCELGSAPSRRLAPEVEIAVFRICQEALSNVLRHAQAESVLIQLEADDRELRIDIEDDGRGFDPAGADRGGRPHYGIMGIRERAEILGGTARIESAPGRGTRVDVRVPLLAPGTPSPESRPGADDNPSAPGENRAKELPG